MDVFPPYLGRRSRPGLYPNPSVSSDSYKRNTRRQSNGGKSLLPETKLRYRQGLAVIRYLQMTGWISR